MNLYRKCLVCNKEFSDLKGHFRRVHKLSNNDYKKMFPEYAEFIESEKKRKMSEAVQRRFKDGSHPFLRKEVREGQRQRILDYHNNKTDEYYAEQRQRAANARAAKGPNYKHSEETKEKMKGPRPSLLGRKASEETRKKLSDIAKGRKRDKHKPETIRKMKEAWVSRKQQPEYEEYIQLLKENAIKHKLGEKYIQNIIDGKASKKFYNTSLENKFIEFLNEQEIDYVHQYVLETNLGKWLFDFYLPSMNMLVETDGEYWHRKSKMIINRDKKKERQATKYGYFFVRISDLYWNPTIIFKSKKEILENNILIIEEREKLF